MNISTIKKLSWRAVKAISFICAACAVVLVLYVLMWAGCALDDVCFVQNGGRL